MPRIAAALLAALLDSTVAAQDKPTVPGPTATGFLLPNG